jgi:hypothetical protein
LHFSDYSILKPPTSCAYGALKIDITRCQACGARIFPEGLEVITTPALIASLLKALCLTSHPPPLAPAKYHQYNLFDDLTSPNGDLSG